ncbi:carboxylating nicotinate-nucleotide diphosphorylase [candidate division WOR-3 bacterium]|nr:carboxylating nicotinate-nucleotide diphosphorylase [candidate division WOR-3 bacterium]
MADDPHLALDVVRLVRAALAEDVGSGDVTSELVVPLDTRCRARIVARAPGVLAGTRVCRRVFQETDRAVRFRALSRDGARFRRGKVLARLSGPARSVLAAERTALNFLQRMSGVATLTARFVAAVDGTGCRVLDTRKTVPGWRALDKYAVWCGGGVNHRRGLHDMVLVKDNHVAVAGSVGTALERCRGARLKVEVEVRNLAEVREALAGRAHRLLLDNMSLGQMRAAVALCRGRARTEASGSITLRRARAIARTGVDFISVGALTHSAPAADIALDFEPG